MSFEFLDRLWTLVRPPKIVPLEGDNAAILAVSTKRGATFGTKYYGNLSYPLLYQFSLKGQLRHVYLWNFPFVLLE